MSIVNVVVRRDQAIIAVDTQAKVTVFDGMEPTMQHKSKMIPMVHANAVLAVRGDPRFMLNAFGQLFELHHDADIDFLAQILPDLLNEMLEHGNPPQATLDSAHEVWAVGWSRKSGRPRAVLCLRRPGSGFVLHEVEEAAGPRPGEGSLPPMWQRDQMIAVARRQVATHREQHPGEAIGGRLLQATINARGITIEELCDLDSTG